MNLISYFTFFKDSDEIHEDFKGHSSATRFIVKKKEKMYFVKIYNGNRIKDLYDINKIYDDLEIPTAQIFVCEYSKDSDKTLCAYEFINGITLKQLIKVKDIKELEKLGKMVGAQVKKFQSVIGSKEKFKKIFDVELNELIKNTLKIKNAFKQELPEVDLERLLKSFIHLKQYIYLNKPSFIHNDINFNNVIINDGIPYFIDTDGGKIKFRALDFRGNCWWGWSGKNKKKEQAVFRGIYLGLFNDNIPEEFHKELAFTMIYEFLLRVNKYKDNAKQIIYSFERFKPIFDQTLYFENYKFDWF